MKNAEHISISLMQHPSYCRGRIYFIIIIIIIYAVGSSGIYVEKKTPITDLSYGYDWMSYVTKHVTETYNSLCLPVEFSTNIFKLFWSFKNFNWFSIDIPPHFLLIYVPKKHIFKYTLKHNIFRVWVFFLFYYFLFNFVW